MLMTRIVRVLAAGALFCALGCAAVNDTNGAPRDAKPRAGETGESTARGVTIILPSDDGDAELDPGTVCVADARAGERVPIDLYFMVDKSGSMKCRPDESALGSQCQFDTPFEDSRWFAVTRALEEFLYAPENEGLGVGIGFFPLITSSAATAPDPECIRECNRNGEGCACVERCGCKEVRTSGSSCLCADGVSGGPEVVCDERDYAPPAQEIATLPGAAQRVLAEIEAQQPNGGTPTVPSLSGALLHAESWAKAHPSKRVALVYVTDGEPFGCEPGNTIADAETLVAQAFAASPSIRTYVIGIGEAQANMNGIAQAGGTERAYLLDGIGDAVQAFSNALANIRDRTLSCDYAIPQARDLDFGQVNVRVSIGGAPEPTLLRQAVSRSACKRDDGWYYDDPSAPTLISLCPETCAELRAAQASQLEVLIGCKTITLLPK